MMSLRRRIEGVLSRLRSEGLTVYPPEDKRECVEVVVEYKGESFFLYAYPGRFGGPNSVVVKLTPNPWDCASALLDPDGLLAVGTDDELVASKVKLKLERLSRVTARLKSRQT